MKKSLYIFLIPVLIIPLLSVTKNKTGPLDPDKNLRKVVDTTGFAQFDWQLEKILKRINNGQKELLEKVLQNKTIPGSENWKVVISPHDDYSYVGYLYPALLKNIRARTIFLFGVAHKAKQLGLKDKIIFDSFEKWHGIYNPVNVSEIREELIRDLPEWMRTVNNNMHAIEHSLEALIPFLQFYNRKIEIIPILVPYMNYKKISEISRILAGIIGKIIKRKGWKWGKDFAFAISSDSVHYGDKGWGGKNFARFGTDKKGYEKAVNYEKEIINNCLTGEITPEKIEVFTKYTVKENDYKEYKWTWCGRYSIPFGLMTSYYLKNILKEDMEGIFVGYGTSIGHPHIKVDDLKMGVTAPANLRHWVGYTAIGYK
ncbi:MAG: AmmeMemoRadiSam system protein B [Acidobacteriota bacterium]